jgi:peptidoglycan L-alanyl-D-glutamate endopeptidase CwlK
MLADMTLGPISEGRLVGVHADLARVVYRAADDSGDLEWLVLEGLRSMERQTQLVADGKSQTMKSRHLTGHAVDLAVLVAGSISWQWPLYEELNRVITRAANAEGVPIEWGGLWKMRDGDHWQLPWERYPIGAPPEGGQVTA